MTKRGPMYYLDSRFYFYLSIRSLCSQYSQSDLVCHVFVKISVMVFWTNWKRSASWLANIFLRVWRSFRKAPIPIPFMFWPPMSICFPGILWFSSFFNEAISDIYPLYSFCLRASYVFNSIAMASISLNLIWEDSICSVRFCYLSFEAALFCLSSESNFD